MGQFTLFRMAPNSTNLFKAANTVRFISGSMGNLKNSLGTPIFNPLTPLLIVPR